MRIAIFCPYSLSHHGGVQGQVVGLTRALRTAGHEAVLLAPAQAPLDIPGLPPDALVVVGRSVPVPANGSVAPVAIGPGAVLRALRTLREREFDLVHLHEPLAPGPGYACLLRAREPKVGTFHRSGTGVAYRIAALPARVLARHLDARCAVSPQASETASSVLGGNYEVMGNGVEVDRFSQATPWPTRGPTLLFVGRHERRKGLGVLLEAWEQVRNGRGARVLWIAGEGPLTAALRARHPPGDDLEWLGPLGDDELRSRLAGAHVLCAPSLGGESFGMVLLEAMAARTAVVASDIPGYGFVAGSRALLVPPGDPAALGPALDRTLTDAADGEGLSSSEALAAGVAHARTWSMEALASRYTSVYRRLVD